MLADVPRILADPLRYLQHAVDTWGDLVAFPVGARPALLVNDPDGVDQVLRRNAGGYGKQTLQYETLSLLTGQGLLTAPTELWRERRRQVAPGFHRRTLEGLLAVVDTAATRMVGALAGSARAAGSGVVVIEDAVLAATLEVVTGALFGADLHGAAARLAHAVVRGLDGVIGRATSPLKLPLAVPTVANIRLRRSLRELDAVVAALVRERASGGSRPEPDLLDLLLLHVAEPVAVRDEIVTLIVAGHETVASALTWALWLLAGHPEIADTLAAEAAEVLDADVGTTLDQLARLRRARAVLDETLRLYPPSWAVSRRALADDVVAGVPVAAGTLVIISPWTLHRRSQSWPDAGAFDPGRFREADSGRRPDYIPFGAGQRLCIGRDFALLEATLLLSRLSAAFVLGRPAGARVTPRARVTVRPRRALALELTPRTGGQASGQASGRVTWSNSRS